MALFAMLLMTLLYPLAGTKIIWRPKRPLVMGVRSLLNGLTSVIVFFSFANLPLTQMYTLMFTIPIFVTLLSMIFLREKVGLKRGLAILVGFTGVIIAIRPEASALTFWHGTALLGVMMIASIFVITRRYAAIEDNSTLAIWSFPGMIVVPLLLWPFFSFPMPSALWLWGVLLACGFLAAAAQILMAYALARLDASFAASFQYTQVPWAFLYGYFLFGERPDEKMFLGVAIIVAAGLYIVFREARLKGH